jgi:hypothetical protein
VGLAGTPKLSRHHLALEAANALTEAGWGPVISRRRRRRARLAARREIFERLQAALALADTDALLQQSTALSSSRSVGQHLVKEPTEPGRT